MNWINVALSGSANSIFFLNKDTGWVGERFGNTRINYTINGGKNWEIQILPSSDAATDIHFNNLLKGWGGRGFNKIFATSDGGNVWGTQSTPNFSGSILSILNDSLGWNGRNGLSKTTNGGGLITSIGIDSNKTNIPTSFILNQNYPNPFNPQTAITFSLNKNSVVSLTIYDITGKEILTLYDNANLNTGNYKAVLDFSKMSSLSSGVYFYTLKVFDEKSKQVFNETKKMMYNK